MAKSRKHEKRPGGPPPMPRRRFRFFNGALPPAPPPKATVEFNGENRTSPDEPGQPLERIDLLGMLPGQPPPEDTFIWVGDTVGGVPRSVVVSADREGMDRAQILINLVDVGADLQDVVADVRPIGESGLVLMAYAVYADAQGEVLATEMQSRSFAPPGP